MWYNCQACFHSVITVRPLHPQYFYVGVSYPDTCVSYSVSMHKDDTSLYDPASMLTKPWIFFIALHHLCVIWQIFTYVLLKRGAAPAAHLLNLRVRVTSQGQITSTPDTKGVCVDEADWCAASCGVLESCCRQFDSIPDVLVIDKLTFSIHKIRRQVCPLVGGVGPNVKIPGVR